MLSLSTILPHTLELLTRLTANPAFRSMRLVGGTSLALQYGHRQSVDLDFFTAEEVDLDSIVDALRSVGSVLITNRTKYILQTIVDGVNVDIVQYSCYPWIDEPVYDSGLVLASDRDIAAMKINAILGRGSKKDFIDLFVLLQHYSLAELLSFYRRKYPEYSEYRALLSMTYFDDADVQNPPVLFIPDTWEDIKHNILSAVKAYQQ